MSGSRRVPRLPVALAAAVALAITWMPADAHRPARSPFTYNEHVYPVIRTHCGGCHVPGGVAPMSLMTHADAAPWAESIRHELMAGQMPPWRLDAAAARVRHSAALTARELDVLLTWAAGGAPQGDPANAPPPVALSGDWPLGTPDVTLSLPEFTLRAEEQEARVDFPVTTDWPDVRWLRAVDLQPGTPSIVRGATILLRDAPGALRRALAPETVLASWLPGDHPVALEGAAAFRLPPGAELIVRVHYRKTWEYERAVMRDRSAIGLYLAPAPAAEVHALTLAAPAAPGPAAANRFGRDIPAAHGDGRFAFAVEIPEDLQALAIYPDAALADAAVTVDIVDPDGVRLPLIAFHPQRDWVRRYWFDEPLRLPPGGRVEVLAVREGDGMRPPGALPRTALPLDAATVRLTLDVVRMSPATAGGR